MVATPISVLITGGAVSFGKTMLNQLLEDGIAEVRALSRDEEKQDLIRNELRTPRVRNCISDIRDRAVFAVTNTSECVLNLIIGTAHLSNGWAGIRTHGDLI